MSRMSYHVNMSTTVKRAPQKRSTPDKTLDIAVGKRVHTRIWDAKLTQEAVARSIGVDAGTFGRKLRGERKWALIELVNLATVLRTTSSYLLGETEDPRPVGPNGELIDVDPRRIELLTSCLQTRELAPVIPIRGSVAA